MAVAAKAATAPKPEDLTDEDWLATYCSSILSHLKHTPGTLSSHRARREWSCARRSGRTS